MERAKFQLIKIIIFEIVTPINIIAVIISKLKIEPITIMIMEKIIRITNII